MSRHRLTIALLGISVLVWACGSSTPGGQGVVGSRELARTAVHQALEGGAFEAMLAQAVASAFGVARNRIEGSGRQLTVEQTQQLESVIRSVFQEVYPRTAWEEALLPLFLNSFSRDELEEVTRFQQTALGRKLALVQAQLATGGGTIGQQLIQSRQAEFTKRLGEQLTAAWGTGIVR
jgi:hypothetical protein